MKTKGSVNIGLEGLKILRPGKERGLISGCHVVGIFTVFQTPAMLSASQ